MNKYQTYSLIGKILALKAEKTNLEEIIDFLKRGNVTWEKFVSLADYHLVLQALYPKIKDHDLFRYFPEEIIKHLKYIFELATKRNLEIIRQTEKLTSVLKKENITPLYLKGVGNILDGLYKYPGERLLHDIDILVPDERLEVAADLLLKDGYRSNYKYDPGLKSQFKHYPILFKHGEPVYVELHRMPVGPRLKKIFNTEMALRTSIHPTDFPDCLVMSDEHKIIHNFLHAHVDHEARIYARHFMRNLYDLFLLSDRKDPEVVFSDFGHFRRASSGYLDITYDTFGITPVNRIKPNIFLHTFRLRYFLNIRYRFIGIASLFIIRVIWGYVVNPLKAITDKELRMKLIAKLRNPEWFKKQAEYYKSVLGIRKNKANH